MVTNSVTTNFVVTNLFLIYKMKKENKKETLLLYVKYDLKEIRVILIVNEKSSI